MSSAFSYIKRHYWGMLATFIALGGTAYASGVLPPHSVGAVQLKRGAVGTAQLERGAVTLAKLSQAAQNALKEPPRQPAPAAANYNDFEQGASWRPAPGYAPVTYYRDTAGVVHLAGAAQSYYFGNGDGGTLSPGPLNGCDIAFETGE